MCMYAHTYLYMISGGKITDSIKPRYMDPKLSTLFTGKVVFHLVMLDSL